MTVNPSDHAEVIVVGAGPTGLLLAGDLAAAGVTTTILERRGDAESNLTRAFGVHALWRNSTPAGSGTNSRPRAYTWTTCVCSRTCRSI